MCSACSAPQVLEPFDAGAEDAGFDAGPPAAIDCTAATTGTDAGCGAITAWATSPTMSRPRNHHVSFLAHVDAGVFLYVIGGYDGTATLMNVDRAKLGDDGSVGAFDRQPDILKPVGGLTGAVLDDRLLVIAGGVGSTGGPTDKASYAPIHPDGTLGEFVDAGSTGQRRMHPAAVERNGWIYVMGGFNHPIVFSDVVKARALPDQSISAFEPGGALPGVRTHMSATRVGDYVYLAGGLDLSPYGNPPDLATVSRGHFDASGNLGDWVDQTPLPVGVATHASAFYGGWLYVMGGISASGQEKRAWRAPVGEDHSLGAWEEIVSLPAPRGHVHQLPIFKNHLYSIAGAVDYALNSTGDIQIGTFAQP